MKAADDLYTEEEVAERLGFSRNWLRRKRLNKEGPSHIVLGNRVMYRGAEVDAWIASLSTDPQECSK